MEVKIHERLRVFAWRLKAEVLPTNLIFFQRTHRGNGNCFACGAEEESLLHIFYECPSIRTLAFGSQWGLRIEKWGITTFKQLISMTINLLNV